VNSPDWLALCRRVVDEHRLIFERYASTEARTEYEGIGEGGDRTLAIDRMCEDAVFVELELIAEQGHSMLAISEERGEVFFGGTEPRHWVVVDPIDGSLNARRMIPSHSFSFAVASGPAMSDVEFGYIFDFGTNQEFESVAGRGSRCNGQSITVGAGSSGMEVVGLESAEPGIAVEAIAALAGHVHRLRVVGSIAITVCQVAAGRFDGMLSLRPCRSVDAAAAQLIVREAGGVVALGELDLREAGFSLDIRYGIAAAVRDDQLTTLMRVQRLRSG